MTPWLVAAGAALVAAIRDRSLLNYLLRHPSVLDGRSIRSIFSFDALPIAGVLAGACAAWGIGSLIQHALRLEADAPERNLIAIGLGFGLLAEIVAALGFLGVFSRALFAALGLIGMAAAAWKALTLTLPSGNIRMGPCERMYSLRTVSPFGGEGVKIALAIAVSYAALDTLIRALAPPVGWDATAYHLVIPKLYLQAGRIIEIPWMKDSYWPHLMETFYCVPLAFHADTAAALTHSFFCGLFVLAVFILGESEIAPGCGWIAAALLACQPVLRYTAADPHCDGALAFYHFLACCAVWRYSKTGSLRWIVAGGLLSGLAAACKLPGLALLAALFLWVAIRPAGKPGSGWKASGLFLACALLPPAPWYLKTFLETGNPVWPFFSSVFGGQGDPAAVASALRAGFGWHWPGDAAILMNYGPEFLLLPLLVFGIIAAASKDRLPPFVKFLWFPAPLFLLVVGPTREAWRYFLPLAPALALSAAYWSLCLLRAGGMRTAVAAAMIAFGVSPVLGYSQNEQLFADLGLQSMSEPGRDARYLYLERSLDYYRIYKKINATLKPSDKLLLYREVRGYYLDVPYQWGEPYHQRLIDYDRLPDVPALRKRLEELGITYVLVHEEQGWYGWDKAFYTPHALDLMRELLERDATKTLQDGPYQLYSLKPPGEA